VGRLLAVVLRPFWLILDGPSYDATDMRKQSATHGSSTSEVVSARGASAGIVEISQERRRSDKDVHRHAIFFGRGKRRRQCPAIWQRPQWSSRHRSGQLSRNWLRGWEEGLLQSRNWTSLSPSMRSLSPPPPPHLPRRHRGAEVLTASSRMDGGSQHPCATIGRMREHAAGKRGIT
jgi:hypothetical protein